MCCYGKSLMARRRILQHRCGGVMMLYWAELCTVLLTPASKRIQNKGISFLRWSLPMQFVWLSQATWVPTSLDSSPFTASTSFSGADPSPSTKFPSRWVFDVAAKSYTGRRPSEVVFACQRWQNGSLVSLVGKILGCRAGRDYNRAWWANSYFRLHL